MLPVVSASARSLGLRSGVIWIGNAYREPYTEQTIEGSDVSPLLTFFGIEFGLPLGNTATFAPGLDLWYKDYAFTEGRAVPTQIETGQMTGPVATTFGFQLSLPFDFRIAGDESWSMSVGIGPSLLLRAPIVPIEGSETAELAEYFYSDLRFLTPELRLGAEFALNERVGISTRIRGFAPATRIADADNELPWWDQLMVSGQVGLSFALGTQPQSGNPDAPAGDESDGE